MAAQSGVARGSMLEKSEATGSSSASNGTVDVPRISKRKCAQTHYWKIYMTMMTGKNYSCAECGRTLTEEEEDVEEEDEIAEPPVKKTKVVLKSSCDAGDNHTESCDDISPKASGSTDATGRQFARDASPHIRVANVANSSI